MVRNIPLPLEFIAGWIVSVIAIYNVLHIQLVEINWTKNLSEISEQKKNYKSEINAQEVDDFVRLWPEFKKFGLADGLFESYNIESKLDDIDFTTKMWFVYHKTDIDRFFYIQDRISSIRQIIKLKKHAIGLMVQLKKRSDDISKQMYAKQEAICNDNAGFSTAEFNIVASKDIIFKQLFD